MSKAQEREQGEASSPAGSSGEGILAGVSNKQPSCGCMDQAENLNLRIELKMGDEAEDAENVEIRLIKSRLDDMISNGVEDGQILQTMDVLKEKYADYGRAHASAAQFHIQELSRLLLPTLTTRACMHAILQNRRAGKAHGVVGGEGGEQGGALGEHVPDR
ncbi:unnamed protein product, partial [Choristocarpus tenellus]